MNIQFQFPFGHAGVWIALTIIAIAVAATGLRMLDLRRRRRLDTFVEAALAPRLVSGYDAGLRRPLFWLFVLGVASLAVAFAQPHWGQAFEAVKKQSRDIVICLDTSESMRAANPLPDRMERAKQKIRTLQDLATGDRFALIAFSGAAALQCPLTLDHGYFNAVLNAIDTDTISQEGTDLGAAMEETLRLFEEEDDATREANRNSRIVLVLSDGEQVTGNGLEITKKLNEYARVFVIGVGDPRGAEVNMPNWMRRYVGERDASLSHVSKLDETALKQIAAAGEGIYVRARADATDIQELYNRFETMAAREVSSEVRYRLVNRFQWPLAVAVACFIGEGLWLALLPWLGRRRTRIERQRIEAMGHV